MPWKFEEQMKSGEYLRYRWVVPEPVEREYGDDSPPLRPYSEKIGTQCPVCSAVTSHPGSVSSNPVDRLCPACRADRDASLRTERRWIAVACVVMVVGFVAFGILVDRVIPPNANRRAQLQEPALQGKWAVQSVVRAGRAEPEERVNMTQIVVEGATATFPPLGSGSPDRWIELDAKKVPRHIDVKYTHDTTAAHPQTGLEPGTLYAGIYRIEGDTLTICISARERPTAFSSDERSGNVLFVASRIK